jgi:hypothetical protein
MKAGSHDFFARIATLLRTHSHLAFGSALQVCVHSDLTCHCYVFAIIQFTVAKRRPVELVSSHAYGVRHRIGNGVAALLGAAHNLRVLPPSCAVRSNTLESSILWSNPQFPSLLGSQRPELVKLVSGVSRRAGSHQSSQLWLSDAVRALLLPPQGSAHSKHLMPLLYRPSHF